jgi:hypothetical protein
MQMSLISPHRVPPFLAEACAAARSLPPAAVATATLLLRNSLCFVMRAVL